MSGCGSKPDEHALRTVVGLGLIMHVTHKASCKRYRVGSPNRVPNGSLEMLGHGTIIVDCFDAIAGVVPAVGMQLGVASRASISRLARFPGLRLLPCAALAGRLAP
jgi:hypothetical protein